MSVKPLNWDFTDENLVKVVKKVKVSRKYFKFTQFLHKFTQI